MVFKRFEINHNGRDLIVGDVHGYFSKLQKALDAVQFDPQKDRLFSVGDLIDRGPQSERVLQWLMQPWFHAVRGNHEQIAMEYLDGLIPAEIYADNGGEWLMNSPKDLQHEVYAVLQALPVAMEVQTPRGLVGIVHADCPQDNWAAFRQALTDDRLTDVERGLLRDEAQWSRRRIETEDETPVQDVFYVVVGHTTVDESASLGNVMYIDTGGWLDNDFTLLNVSTLQW